MTKLRRSFGLYFELFIPRSPFFRYGSASCHPILALLNAAAAYFTIVKQTAWILFSNQVAQHASDESLFA